MSAESPWKVYISYCPNEPRLNNLCELVSKMRKRAPSELLDFTTINNGGGESNGAIVNQHAGDPAENWGNSLAKKEIDDADVILVVISKSYKDCKYCNQEATYIFNKRTRGFVPIKMLSEKLDGWIGFAISGKLYIEFLDFTKADRVAMDILIKIYAYLEEQSSNGAEEQFKKRREALTKEIKDSQRRSGEFGGELAMIRRVSSINIDDKGEKVKDPNVLITFHWKCNPEHICEQLAPQLAMYNLCIQCGEGNSFGSAYTNVAKQVDLADIVIIAYSDAYKESKLCRDGALYAKERGKKIIPLKQQANCVVDGWLDTVFGSTVPIDFLKPDRQNIEAIIARIAQELERPIERRNLQNRSRNVSEMAPSDPSPAAKEADSDDELTKSIIYVTHCNLSSKTLPNVKTVLEDLKKQPVLIVQLGKEKHAIDGVDLGQMAQKIEDCDMAVLFLTEESLQCPICRREIDYIVEMKKRYVLVELERGWSAAGGAGSILGVGKTVITISNSRPPALATFEVLQQICGYLENQNPEMKDYYSEKGLEIQKQIWTMQATLPDDSDEEFMDGRTTPFEPSSARESELGPKDNRIALFISYSWAEPARPDHVRKVADLLQEQTEIGLNVWIDTKEMTTTIKRCMAEGIEKSEVVVIFYSHEYKTSDNCKKEAHFAQERNAMIIPVRMQADCHMDGWLAMRLNQKQASIDFTTPEEVCKEIVSRILVTKSMKIMKVNIPSVPEDWHHVDEVSILSAQLKEFCTSTNNACPAVLVSGKRGVGKSTLVSHLVGSSQHDNFLLDECHIQYIAWINALDMLTPESTNNAAELKTQFLEALEQVFMEALKISILGPTFSAINNALAATSPGDHRFLLVLDNVRDRDLLKMLQELSPSVRCIAIADADTLNAAECVDQGLVSSVVNVALTASESFLRLKCIAGSDVDSSRLTLLADKCHKLPGIIALLRVRLEAENNGIKVVDSIIEEGSELSPKDVTVSIMEHYFASEARKDSSQGQLAKTQYLSLLFFDHDHSVDIRDIACLWELSNDLPLVHSICLSLKRVGLLMASKESKDEFKYYLDKVLFDAAFEYAVAEADFPASIGELRQNLITPMALRNALRSQRFYLLSFIISRLDANTLASLCRDQSAQDRRTFLQVLFSFKGHWRKFIGTSSEKSVSLEFLVKILEKLKAAGIDVIQILALPDANGDCLLLDIRECKTDQSEEMRFAQIVESYGAYKVRSQCFEVRLWFKLADKLCASTSHQLLFNALLGEVSIALAIIKENPEQVNEGFEPSSETPLSAACAKGHFDIVKALVENRANVNVSNSEGVTPLMKASLGGFIEIVYYLYTKGAQLNAVDRTGNTAMMLAAIGGYKDIVELLADKGADISLRNKKSMNVLYYAAQNGFESIVEMMVKQGGRFFDLSIAFRYAAQNGHQSIASLLLSYKAKIESEATKQMVPILIVTALNGHQEMVKLLIEKGLKLDVRDPEDYTALMHAVRHGHLGVVEVLVQAGAKVNAKKKSGTTALFYAAQYGYVDIAKFLVSKGAEVDARNSAGRTPLMRAVESDQDEIVLYLLEKGAKISAKDNGGYTAVMIAANGGNAEMVYLLAKKGANVDEANGHYETPLMAAARNGFYDVVRYLLECGANVNLRDRASCTALHYAVVGTTKAHYAIAELLKSCKSLDESLLHAELRRKHIRPAGTSLPSPTSSPSFEQSVAVLTDFSSAGFTDTVERVRNPFERKSSSVDLPPIQENYIDV